MFCVSFFFSLFGRDCEVHSITMLVEGCTTMLSVTLKCYIFVICCVSPFFEHLFWIFHVHAIISPVPYIVNQFQARF